MLRGGDSAEFFHTYAPTSRGKLQSAHKHWPKNFVLGVHRDGPNITIGGNPGDRSDAWLVVEGLNRPGVQPASLYLAQVERKRATESGVGDEDHPQPVSKQ